MRDLAERAVEVLDGRTLTREELIAAVAAGAPYGDRLRSGWGTALKPLAWQGLLCHGPSQGNRVTFTSPASWAPGWRDYPDVDEAAQVPIPAYLGAYGHLVALHAPELAYSHVHPNGTDRARGAITFDTELPKHGRYRLFLQFRTEGRVHTVAFTQTAS